MLDDRSRYAPGEPLLPQRADDPRKLGPRRLVEDLVGRPGGIRTHPHIERTLMTVREAALRLVELMARDTEIEQDPGNLVQTPARQNPVQVAEVGHGQLQSLVRERAVDGGGITIDAEDADRVVEPGEKSLCVTASAKGRVDDHPVLYGREQVHNLLQHHGYMERPPAHRLFVPDS